jgi:hypothetical protein
MNATGIIVSERLLGHHKAAQGLMPVYELLLLDERKQCNTIYATPLPSGTDIVYPERPTIEQPAMAGKVRQ